MTRAAQNRQLVMRHLRITADRYAELVYEEGVRYLAMYMADDAAGRAVLESMPAYWSWWKVQWAKFDEDFIQRCDFHRTGPQADQWIRSLMLDLYYTMHDGSMLSRVRISRNIMLQALRLMQAEPVRQAEPVEAHSHPSSIQ